MIQKLKKFYYDNNNILSVLCLFIIIQPFLDIREFFINKDLEIFGITIPTIIRCLFIGFLIIISLKNIKNKKHYLFLVIYLFIILTYTINHHYIAINSKMIIPSNYVYSLTTEVFYIIRMILPLAIIYFTYNSKIQYNHFIKSILISSLIIGIVIFIGNTLCISYTAYETSENITKLNWIGWFTNLTKYFTFEEMTSKGWFYMANQVSGLMLLLLPFCIYDMLKNINWLNLLATFSLLISMIMIGSRTASYGWILIIAAMLFLIILLVYMKKQKWWNLKRISPLFIILFIGLIFFSVSPINIRKFNYSIGNTDNLEKAPTKVTNENREQAYNYITKNYSVYKVPKIYIYDIYNYKFDPEFWLDIFEISKNGALDNRKLQVQISKRIVENNKYDIKYSLFGYSFSRMRSGALYMEHDFIVQSFTMGLIGVILLIGPYILIILQVIRKSFKNLFKTPKLIDYVFIISTCAMLGASLFTGHILDELFVTIYLGFVCGFFLKRTITKEVKIDEKD